LLPMGLAGIIKSVMAMFGRQKICLPN